MPALAHSAFVAQWEYGDQITLGELRELMRRDGFLSARYLILKGERFPEPDRVVGLLDGAAILLLPPHTWDSVVEPTQSDVLDSIALLRGNVRRERRMARLNAWREYLNSISRWLLRPARRLVWWLATCLGMDSQDF